MRPPSGVLIGRVTDTTGSRVAEADLVISRESDSLVVAAGRTDSQGTVRLPRVPSGGPYTILARKIGYKPAHTTGVYVRAGDTLELSFVLQPHVVVLPELATGPDRRFSLIPRVMTGGGFVGIRLFKCLFIGVGAVDERAVGCTENADAHAARHNARKAAGEVQRVTRRVQKAQRAGRRPDPADGLLVLSTARTCNKEVPKRPPWPRPDPDVRCREIFNRVPQDTLVRLGEMLAAIDATESFKAELGRIDKAQRRRFAESRANRLAAMLAEAEARYVAEVVQEAASRVELAIKRSQHPDSKDARLVHDAAEACGGEVLTDEVYCRAILKRTSRKTLERLIARVAARDSTESKPIPVTREEKPVPHPRVAPLKAPMRIKQLLARG